MKSKRNNMQSSIDLAKLAAIALGADHAQDDKLSNAASHLVKKTLLSDNQNHLLPKEQDDFRKEAEEGVSQLALLLRHLEAKHLDLSTQLTEETQQKDEKPAAIATLKNQLSILEKEISLLKFTINKKREYITKSQRKHGQLIDHKSGKSSSVLNQAADSANMGINTVCALAGVALPGVGIAISLVTKVATTYINQELENSYEKKLNQINQEIAPLNHLQVEQKSAQILSEVSNNSSLFSSGRPKEGEILDRISDQQLMSDYEKNKNNPEVRKSMCRRFIFLNEQIASLQKKLDRENTLPPKEINNLLEKFKASDKSKKQSGHLLGERNSNKRALKMDINYLIAQQDKLSNILGLTRGQILHPLQDEKENLKIRVRIESPTARKLQQYQTIQGRPASPFPSFFRSPPSSPGFSPSSFNNFNLLKETEIFIDENFSYISP